MQQGSVQVDQAEQVDGGAQARDQGKLADEAEEVSWGLFTLFSFIYVLEGLMAGLGSTMPYVYPSLPDTQTMALFNSVRLPLSFKFILAPFMEKFAPIEYGKRKIYMVFGLTGAGLSLLFCALLTNQSQAKPFALVMMIGQCMVAVTDIAAHAVMVKQLGSVGKSSVILSYGQVLGSIIGTMVLLKFTSHEFADSVGLDGPITTPQTVIAFVAVLFFVPALYLHFIFRERLLASERRGMRFTFCEILGYYRIFLKLSSRYCRMCLLFLLYLQGFNFFNSLYDYELVKRGFSRNTANTISIIISIPVAITNFFFPKFMDWLGGRTTSYRLSFTIIILANMGILIWFPLSVWWVALFSLVSSFSQGMFFFVSVVQINEFPVHALTGMFITVSASVANLGGNTALHTEIAGRMDWELWSWIGMVFQVATVIWMQRIMDWVYDGHLYVPRQIEERPMDQKQQHLDFVRREKVDDHIDTE